MALITLALAPVALMLMFEVKFLPHHSEKITWWHRGLLALDLALVWTLWPGYRMDWGVRLWPKKSWRLVRPCVLSAAAVAYAVLVATFPDERVYMATYWLHGSSYPDRPLVRASPRDRPNWYPLIAWANTLDLDGEDLIDDKKLADIITKNEGSTDAQRWVATLSLAGRDLTGASLREADVRHVDFSGAILNRASIIGALATKAHFDNAELQGASLDGALLQGASLYGALLQGASLYDAQLQGARLDYAQLQGAKLDVARLQRASLKLADLQGASLDYAQLQGASLREAKLQGASLDSAQLMGASLERADLQGASRKRGAPGRLARQRAAPRRVTQQGVAPGRVICGRVCLESRRSKSVMEGHKGRPPGDWPESK
jgi:uncharacterized protein YjbI with pentapeptide repeats